VISLALSCYGHVIKAKWKMVLETFCEFRLWLFSVNFISLWI